MPTRSVEVGKEGVRCFADFGILPVERFGEDPDFRSRLCWSEWVCGSIHAVLCGEEHGAEAKKAAPLEVHPMTKGPAHPHSPCREHDRRVIRKILMIERDQPMNDLVHERVLLCREDQVVGNADWFGSGKNDVPVSIEHGVETTFTSDVEVHINATISVKDTMRDQAT